jgi:predicted metal-binding membrane protein
MVYDPREFARLRRALLLLGALGWSALLAAPGALVCCLPPGASLSWSLVLSLNPPSALARGWILMLVAMMAPMLGPPVYHVWAGSFGRRRLRSIGCFAVGYTAVWLAAGGVLLAVELAIKTVAPQSWEPVLAAAVVAAIWQASPAKQVALNRGHAHRPFAAFGFAADWDLVRFGAEHGRWCVASCWALMLAPLLVPAGHLGAMAAVGTLMFCERLDPPRAPTWRWRGFGTAVRYLRIRWFGADGSPAPCAVSVHG